MLRSISVNCATSHRCVQTKWKQKKSLEIHKCVCVCLSEECWCVNVWIRVEIPWANSNWEWVEMLLFYYYHPTHSASFTTFVNFDLNVSCACVWCLTHSRELVAFNDAIVLSLVSRLFFTSHSTRILRLVFIVPFFSVVLLLFIIWLFIAWNLNHLFLCFFFIFDFFVYLIVILPELFLVFH